MYTCLPASNSQPQRKTNVSSTFVHKNQKIAMSNKRSMDHFTKVATCLIMLITFLTGSPPATGQTPSAEQAKTKPHNPVIFENKYWIFPTYSAKYRQQVFLDAFTSTDMVTWKKHPKIVDTSNIKWAYMAMWAPSIVKKDNKYFLFFSANDIQSKARNGVKDDTLGGIGIAVADKPGGPYKDHLGKPLINQFYNNAQPIDQFVFQDKDGQYYIIYGGWGRCNIGKLNENFTS